MQKDEHPALGRHPAAPVRLADPDPPFRDTPEFQAEPAPSTTMERASAHWQDELESLHRVIFGPTACADLDHRDISRRLPSGPASPIPTEAP